MDNVYLSSHRECRKLIKNGNQFSFQQLAQMVHPRNGHSVCHINETHLIVTGSRIQKAESAEVYNIAQNKWTEIAEMRQGRYYHSSCAFNFNRVYVFCGIEASTKKYLDTIEYIVHPEYTNWQ